MNNKVKVTADAAGNVIIPTKNPELAYIRVVQIRPVINDMGFAHNRPVSALIFGHPDVLKSWKWTKDQEIEGTVIFRESLKPFSNKEPERDYKIAGDTKVVCCVDGSPIYRKSFYSQKPNQEDVLIAHTNGEDIKTAFRALMEARKQEKL